MENIIAALAANHFSWFPRRALGEDGLGELAGAGEDGVHEVKGAGTKMSKHGKVAAGLPGWVKRNGRRYFSNPGLSRKVENRACALALHYNFGHLHKTLRVAPAMEAGIADPIWTLEPIAILAN